MIRLFYRITHPIHYPSHPRVWGNQQEVSRLRRWKSQISCGPKNTSTRKPALCLDHWLYIKRDDNLQSTCRSGQDTEPQIASNGCSIDVSVNVSSPYSWWAGCTLFGSLCHQCINVHVNADMCCKILWLVRKTRKVLFKYGPPTIFWNAISILHKTYVMGSQWGITSLLLHEWLLLDCQGESIVALSLIRTAGNWTEKRKNFRSISWYFLFPIHTYNNKTNSLQPY